MIQGEQQKAGTASAGVIVRLIVAVLPLLLASCATLPAPEEADDAVLALREYGSWAWAIGIVLIWADVVLPIPQTAVIAALGIVYGALLGGLLGSIGLVTGGLLGYGLMFTSARRFAQRFAASRSMHKMESLLAIGAAPGRSFSPAAFRTASRRA